MKHTLFIKYIGSLLFTLFLAGCSDVYEDSLWTVSKQAESLGLSLNQLGFTSDAGSKSLNVTGQNIPWRFSNNAQWVSFSPSSGQSAASVEVSVQDNTSEVARTAYAQLVSTAQSASRTYDLTISQSAKEPYIRLSQSSLDFKGEGASTSVSVESNRTWTFQLADAATASWLSVTRNGNALTITASVNEGSAAREAYINVTTGTLTEQIHVIQRVADVTASMGSLEFGNSQSSQNLTLNADVSWKASCSQSWIQVSPNEGTSGTHTLKVSVFNNVQEDTRTGYIYIMVGQTKRLEIEVTQSGSHLSVSPIELTFDSQSSSRDITIAGNTSWNLYVSDATWLHLDKTSGNGASTVRITADENTGEQRSNTVTLVNAASSAIVQTINIVQKAPGVSVTPGEFEFNIKGGTKTLYISTALSWLLESNVDWLTISQNSGNGDGAVDVTVSANPTSGTRTGALVLRNALNNAVLKNISVRQTSTSFSVTPQELTFSPEGDSRQVEIETSDSWSISHPDWLTANTTSGTGDAKLTFTAKENTNAYELTGKINVLNSVGVLVKDIPVSQPAFSLTCSQGTLTFGQAGGEQSLQLSSNVSWLAEPSAEWLTVSPLSGSGNASLTVAASQNPYTTSRSASVVFKSKSGRELYKVNVTQAAVSLSASPTSLAFPVEGGSKDLSVTANANWILTCQESWITLSSASGNGSQNVKVQVASNTSSNTRKGNILLKNNTEVVQTIEVTQSATSYSISPTSLNVKADGETTTLSVTANSDWTLSSNADWAKVNTTQGTGNKEVTLTVDENLGSARKAKVTLNDAEGKQVDVVDITQDSYTLSVYPTSLTFDASDAAGQSFSIECEDYVWTASANVSWVVLSRESGNGDATVSVSVHPNTTGGQRTAEIEVSCGNRKQTVTVTQKKNITGDVTPTSLSFPVTGGSKELSITTNDAWSLLTDADWLTFSKSSGQQDAKVSVSASANNSTSSVRTASIKLQIAGGSIVKTIDVTQTALSLSATLGKSSFGYEGGSTTLSVTANSGWRLTAPAWVTLSASAGSGNQNVGITVQPNGSTVAREDNIVLTNTDGSVSIPIPVTQAGCPETTEDVRDLGQSFPSKGGSLEVTPVETDNWTAEVVKGGEWISLSASSGTSSQRPTITTADNPYGLSRMGSVRITYGFHSYLYNVVQLGKTISLNTAVVDFFAKGGESQSITVTADKAPTVTTYAGWLTVKQSGNTFTLVAEKNTDSTQRTATVKVSLAGVSDLEPVTVTVRQAGYASDIVVDDYVDDGEWGR